MDRDARPPPFLRGVSDFGSFGHHFSALYWVTSLLNVLTSFMTRAYFAHPWDPVILLVWKHFAFIKIPTKPSFNLYYEWTKGRQHVNAIVMRMTDTEFSATLSKRSQWFSAPTPSTKTEWRRVPKSFRLSEWSNIARAPTGVTISRCSSSISRSSSHTTFVPFVFLLQMVTSRPLSRSACLQAGEKLVSVSTYFQNDDCF